MRIGWVSGSPKRRVVFQDPRAALGHHQARIEHAAIGRAVAVHAIDRRHEDFADDLVHEFVGDDRRRAVSAHAAGVVAGVVVADGFVVLGGLHDIDTAAIDKRQDRGLLSEEFVLDENSGPGGAEDFFAEDFFGGEDAVGRIVADEHALALGQAGRLDHDGFVARGDVGLGVLEVVERAALGGGDGTGPHDLLGERLVGLDLGGVAGGTEGLDACGLEGIDNAGGQRVFRADHGKIDPLVLGEGHKAADVVGGDLGVGAALGGTRIARSDKELLEPGRLLSASRRWRALARRFRSTIPS